MKTFEYRGLDQGGFVQRGLVEALDTKEARDKLLKRGIMAERLDPATDLSSRGARRQRDSSSVWEWSLLYRELGSLLDAGVSLTRALEILIDSPEHGENRGILAGIRDRVREGMPLADALSASRRTMRPFEKAVIAAGEKAGTLSPVLERLAIFVEEEQQLKERVLSALVYPGIVLSFAFVVAVVMLGFVVPFMGRMLQESHIAMPLLTRVMMKVGSCIMWGGPVALAAGGALIWHFRRRRAADELFARRVDRRLYRLPVIGTAYRILVNLRFTRTLAILLRGGVPIIESLGFAGRATGSPWLEWQVGVEAERVRHGSTVADAVRRVTPLASSLPGWIQTGEASGAIERMLDMAGDRFQYQWNRFVARCLTFIEPALILFVGLIVLLVAMSIVLPVVSLNRTTL